VLELLSDPDREVIHRRLRAASDGPFFEDWEFGSLFGLERSEVRAVLARWPSVLVVETTWLAINNSIGNLLGYPHGYDLQKHIGVDAHELGLVFERWRAAFPDPK
jgi:hypothetical protein